MTMEEEIPELRMQIEEEEIEKIHEYEYLEVTLENVSSLKR